MLGFERPNAPAAAAAARSAVRCNRLLADRYSEKDLADELSRWDFQLIVTCKESLPLIGHPALGNLKGPPEHIDNRIVRNPVVCAAD